MSWLFFVVFNTTLKMFWELRPQGVSSSFTQQNLPKQSLSYIGVPLGLTLLLVNLFDFLIQRRPNEIWHNSVKLVDFNGSEYIAIPYPDPSSSLCLLSKWWILDRYHVPLGSVGGTQPWRVKMSAMGVAVESREVARSGSSQLARLTWLWTWVGEHPQVIYLDQHFDPHPLCNGRMSPPCIERQAGH